VVRGKRKKEIEWKLSRNIDELSGTIQNIGARGKKCQKKSMNPVNARIPATGTEIARPARNITRKMGHQQIAEEPTN